MRRKRENRGKENMGRERRPRIKEKQEEGKISKEIELKSYALRRVRR